jgi:hypothetical protein
VIFSASTIIVSILPQSIFSLTTVIEFLVCLLSKKRISGMPNFEIRPLEKRFFETEIQIYKPEHFVNIFRNISL